ncbi:SDR family oxidoreductase [Candidatus Pelagibacter sp.]|nr:SDR family oxidoreductase [Candidatus Pelagibacter sp.]|tara:strand:+ start:2953 stop:3987 length:1035 start_codon:yes stop_codon:yes gene_type:complete
MKVLVTGNLGYIGSVLTKKLNQHNFEVIGLDIGYFKDCITSKTQDPIKQLNKDLRDINEDELKNIDHVIHLASLSNDPLGEFIPALTEEINYSSTIKLAEYAKLNKVKRFIFASTQSIYGISKTDSELQEDSSFKDPITAYAKTKWKAEQEIMKMATDDFCVSALRPSTVFGPSPRFRADIVFNNLVSCAYTSKKIEIWSDGSPWRPVIHVEDVCEAFIACLLAPEKDVNKEAFNVGVPGGNYTVKDLAEAAKKCFPEANLVFLNNTGNDNRTYKVNFDKINTILSKYFKPKWNLNNGGVELINYLKNIDLSQEDFRGKKTIRLKQLAYLKDNDICNDKLKFIA